MPDTAADLDGVMRITVIMPAFNCPAFLARSLPPLLELQRRGEIAEVIVVDDGSTDETAASAAELGARVLPSGGHRRGPGAARNEAARLATGEVLWFVDADVVVHLDSGRHLRMALAEPGVVAVFGSYDDHPAAANLLSQYKNLVHHYYHQCGRREASTFWAGCGAVRRDAFLAVGGFDIARFRRPSIEDIELGYRLRAAGGRILLCPQCQATHLKVWRLRGLLETDLLQRAIPWSRLLMAGEGPGGDLNVGMTEQLRALLACILAVALPAALFGIVSWWLVLALTLGAFMGNIDLFALLARRNGGGFALGGLAFHQFYYLYSTAAYTWCWAEARIWRRLAAAPLDATNP